MLPAELDQLPYPRRVPTLLAMLRGLDDPEPAVAQLAGGGPDERFLAVTAATALGLRAVVAGAVEDPDPSVRAVAVRNALRAGWIPAPQLLADAPAASRRMILRRLRERPGSGDEIIDLVRERHGDREAALALPACTTATVERLLPDLAPAVVSWKALGHRHGSAVLAHAAARLAEDGPLVWDEITPAVGASVHAGPELVLDLLERHPLPAGLPPVDLRLPARAAPARVLRLLLGHTGDVPATAVLRSLRDLPIEDLAALVRNRPGPGPMLAALPPGRRAALYDALPPAGPFLDDRSLSLVPSWVRHREARRVLALPEVAAHETDRARWSAYLPGEEALPVLDELARAADPRSRATAYDRMGELAGREPGVLPAVLARYAALRHEQDPVRRHVVRQLTTLARHIGPESAGLLTRIVDDALAAPDLSGDSRRALGTLPWELLERHPDEPALVRWSLDTIARLPGTVPADLGDRLRPGQEHLVVAALHHHLTADAAVLCTLAESLGRRAWAVPDLQDLLHLAATDRDGHPQRAVPLWLADPSTRDERVATLIAWDPSTVQLDAVWRAVCARRTDLLDAVLPGPPLGLMVGRRARWRPGPPHHVRRWLPRQRRAYAEALAAIAADPALDTGFRAAALTDAAKVPGIGREILAVHLHPSATDPSLLRLHETALRGLPWTDRPGEELGELLAHASDDHARVALSAAERAARFVAPSHLLTHLGDLALGRTPGAGTVPTGPGPAGAAGPVRPQDVAGAAGLAGPAAVRLTSRKAAVRLLGRYGPPGAVDVLAQVWRQGGAHRDLRAAVVAAVRGRWTSPVTWVILAEAATGTREEIAAVLAVDPRTLTRAARVRYAPLVAATCTGPDRTAAAAGWETLPSWIPWAPDVTGMVVGALCGADPANGLRAPGQARLIDALLTRPPQPGRGFLEQVAERLVARDAADPDPGTSRADRPARRRLESVVEDAQGPWQHPEPVRRAALHLAGIPRFRGLAATLLVSLVDLGSTGPDPLVAGLAEISDLLTGRPVLAARLAEQLGSRVIRDSHRVRPATVLAVVNRLGAREDKAGGLFALALFQAGTVQGWSDPWLAALHRLRAHPDADVADAAYARTPAP
ncbi:hypothetical protein [Actinoplanes sp. NPDC051494]|uniref:hypothetical protein n=1 Tax=Actinoplanes sp. NPDC051494 TaxID=3363907 RepID=UPI0037A0F01C